MSVLSRAAEKGTSGLVSLRCTVLVLFYRGKARVGVTVVVADTA